VCAVEIDEYNQSILRARQSDGCLPPFPIYSDICQFDGTEWVDKVDIVCGGFPCQNLSSAGKGGGIDGSQSGLVREMLRVIGEIKPKIVFAENSPNLRTKGLSYVTERLTEMGYDCAWGVIGASSIGAKHKRERLWIMADSNESRYEGDGWSNRTERWVADGSLFGKDGQFGRGSWDVLWEAESKLERVLPHGVSAGVDRHYAIGNAQVPQVAAYAFKTLYTRLRG
jgi:DNA (cytosine-5)-methyltransferase 1